MNDRQTDHLHIEQRGLARVFYAISIAILIGFILYVARGILIPLVIAMFLSFLIVTLKTAIRRIPFLGKLLPEFIAYILSFAVIALILITLGQIITANATDIIRAGPDYQRRLQAILIDIGNFLESLPFVTDWIVSNVEAENTLSEDGTISREGYAALLTQFQQEVLGFISGIASEIGQAIRALAQNIVTILLYTSFMLIERGALLRKLGIVAGMQEAQLDIGQIINDIGDLVRQYISIKTLMGLTTATFSFIIMTLLGIDFAGFWALLIFALGYVPIIGAISGVMLPSILALVQPDGGGITLFLLTLGLLTVAEQTVSSVIEPRLMGRSLNLSPLIILLSLTVWGTLWGFAGMLLCVPITVSLMIVCSQFQDTRPIAVLLSDNGEISPIKRLVREEQAEGI
ncbi:AI-2E family transporter [Parvularcula flava]|uniref:AI-2E family transporter n=1 Tax=Aquisalinus luteolus TaxID=1566827 RepID=A0A8J3EPE6_9PROT|nr:AI-2E family transporter [Aquisalinus luteolus]NHK27975.1 AI-2E family transporter [Aquisalinus luteolus]GGH97095.1 AI-2E family transporter [Aquisalinus luteolus]